MCLKFWKSSFKQDLESTATNNSHNSTNNIIEKTAFFIVNRWYLGKGNGITIKSWRVIHRGATNFFTSPSCRCWDISNNNWKLWAFCGAVRSINLTSGYNNYLYKMLWSFIKQLSRHFAKRQVKLSSKSIRCILWGPLISVPKFQSAMKSKQNL